MSIKKYLPALIALAAFFFAFQAHAASYTYYRAITVTSTTSLASSTQTNFPMLVSSTVSSWKSLANGGHIQNLVTAPSGIQEPADLVFATSTANCGSENLNFETESYSSSTGAVIDWVNVPTMSAGAVIYACYDNETVTSDQSHPSSTWNSNYATVWHFPNGSTLNTNDSTGNVNNLTNNGAVATTSGEIDGAASFNGTTNYMKSSSTIAFGATTPITFSAWINSLAISSTKEIIRMGDDKRFLLSFNSEIGFTVNNDTYADAGNPTLTSGLHYVVGTWDGTNVRVYMDGVLRNTVADTATAATSNAFVGSTLSDTQNWDGVIDEARISTVALTPSWILTEYNNEYSPSTFYALGSETPLSPSGVARVQNGYSYPGNSVTLTGTTAGDFLIYSYSYESLDTSATCSDGVNTWNVIATTTNNIVNTALVVGYAQNIAGGTVTVTCPTESDNGLAVAEYSGVASSNPIDTSVVSSSLGTSATSTINWPSIAASAGESVFAAGAAEGGGQIVSWASPFTLVHNGSGHYDSQADLLNTTAGSYAAQATLVSNVGQYWAGVEATLKPSASTPITNIIYWLDAPIRFLAKVVFQ